MIWFGNQSRHWKDKVSHVDENDTWLCVASAVVTEPKSCDCRKLVCRFRQNYQDVFQDKEVNMLTN